MKDKMIQEWKRNSNEEINRQTAKITLIFDYRRFIISRKELHFIKLCGID